MRLSICDGGQVSGVVTRHPGRHPLFGWCRLCFEFTVWTDEVSLGTPLNKKGMCSGLQFQLGQIF
jgi:hypothetical protein